MESTVPPVFCPLSSHLCSCYLATPAGSALLRKDTGFDLAWAHDVIGLLTCCWKIGFEIITGMWIVSTSTMHPQVSSEM